MPAKSKKDQAGVPCSIPRGVNWITLDDWRFVACPEYAPFVAVRRDISVPGTGKTRIFITASAGYTLWVNGLLVGSGPARSWPGRWLADCHEISSFVRKGLSRIAVLIHPPTGGRAYRQSFPVGLAAWVTAGRRLVSATDDSWLTCKADWISHFGLISALPTGWQEHHSRLDKWMVEKPGSGWKPATVLGPAGETPPWGKVSVSDLPSRVETDLKTPFVWFGKISYKSSPESNLALVLNRAAARSEAELPQAGRPVWLECGGVNSLTVDTGRTRSMRPGCRILKVEGEVRLDCFIDISLNGRPTAGTGFGIPREGSADSLSAERPVVWWRTQPRGGRFVTWCASGRGRVLINPLCRAVEYPYPDDARFKCEDSFLMRLWELAGETVRASTTDVLVDTCFREDALWTFDACATGLGAYFRFGDTKMTDRCLRMIAGGVKEDGSVPAIVPSEGEGMSCMLLDQTLSWVHSCMHWHELTGDDEFAGSVLPAVLRVMGLVKRSLNDGFLVPPSWTWHWVDWAAIDKRPYSAAINLLALRAARAAARLGLHAGDQDAVLEMNELAGVLERSCRKFMDKGTGAWKAHCKPAGRVPDPGWIHNMPHDSSVPVSLHVNGLALGLGLGGGAARTCAGLLSALPGPANSFGPGWTADLLTPCCPVMDTRLVLEYLKATYGRCFVDTGAPAFGERFEETAFNTAHGWGSSVMALIVEGLLGLRPAGPGWSRIRFEPVWPCGGDVEYILKTARGTVGVRRRSGVWHVRAPEGTEVLASSGSHIAGTGWIRLGVGV